MFGSARKYSLRKSRHILHNVNRQYRRHWKRLTDSQLAQIENLLRQLDEAVERGDRETADRLARGAEEFQQEYLPQQWWMTLLTELPAALLIALLVAVVVRQMWFELYQIPTGSMRPSFKEQDHLIVSKTTFGINVPLTPKHLYFNPETMQRTGVVIFTAENLDTPDPDTKYFWLFNAKKRFIKRLIGKPGDTLYFYGGKIYGIDAEGNAIKELLNSPWLEKLEHIPFGRFEGRMAAHGPRSTGRQSNEFVFSHMHQPVARMTIDPRHGVRGEVYSDGKWIPEQPLAVRTDHDHPVAMGDFWGIKNFGMARILTAEEVERYTQHDLGQMEKGELYLEIFHNPGLTHPSPLLERMHQGGIVRGLATYRSLIPLQARHLERLADAMYTARFVVQDGLAVPYSAGGNLDFRRGVSLPEVPSGTYELYYGKAREIGFVGRPIELEASHPLHQRDPNLLHTLYNAGIDVVSQVLPSAGQRAALPSRYVYMRDGDLYLMGSPIFEANDPILASFLERELEKEASASSYAPYLAFRDYGAPVNSDGSFDKDFIQRFGYRIPDGHYMCLGDNHAMSADSRYFGMVPEENFRGTPVVVLWPWDERYGQPPQDGYPTFTLPRLIVWGIALCLVAVWYAIHRTRMRHPIFVKISEA